MFLLSLAWRSLGNRRLISALTAASIALSVALLVGIEHVRMGVRESFAGTIRGTDLIVGARGGTTQVLLSTVFGMSVPNGSVSWATYQRWAAHPAVKWTIPYALGDAHRGHRVIGTTAAFFEHYRFRDRSVTFASGRAPGNDREIAIGSDVAERLGYSVGSKVTLAHGLGAVMHRREAVKRGVERAVDRREGARDHAAHRERMRLMFNERDGAESVGERDLAAH